MSKTTDIILVQTNLPDQDSAENIARHLVAEKLAACVNIMAPCTSIYHWQGKIESAAEIPLLIKTTEQRYAAVEADLEAAERDPEDTYARTAATRSFFPFSTSDDYLRYLRRDAARERRGLHAHVVQITRAGRERLPRMVS